ncbi:MAG: hypothetical protein V7609_1959 [Verrucomicrobiota bacterium]
MFVCDLSSVEDPAEPLTFDLDSFRNKSYLTHNFHPFAAKFVPQIPRAIIRRFTKPGDTILDCFCGSGTALVEAIIAGRHAVGLDVNPIACLVSRAKTAPLSSVEQREVLDSIDQASSFLREVLLGDPTRLANFEVPEFHNRDHWFQSHVQHELAALRSIIRSRPEGRVRDFLSTALSAIIVKVSNQESETRWVAVPKTLPRGVALSSFILKAREMLVRLSELESLVPATARVLNQSVTESFPLPDNSIDLVVTSPPYLNSFDYYLYHKLRMFWLGFDHFPVQESELGSRHRHCDKREGIETYTDGIEACLHQAVRCLKARQVLCVVIGDAVLRNAVIDMKELYSRLARTAGLELEESFSFDQRKYTTAFTRNYKKHPKKTHVLCFRRR